MKRIITHYFFFISIFTFAQNEFKKGIIIDSISIPNIEKETFALYLPSTYTNEKASSIIYVFEPRARGKKGIKPFIKASETYGHILVCSNNSKNGSYDKNFKIFNNLSYYTHTIFKIKKNEMYLSGFSGGARLASAIANITDVFSGVIGCGAGFPQVEIPETKTSSQNYNYVGLCGNLDFNYDEMTHNKAFLDTINFNNTLITYKGGHSWPKENEILRAFNWLHLHKLKNNNDEPNKKEIIKLYKSDYKKTLEYLEQDELIFAFENYERILQSYTPFLKIDSINTRFNDLKKSKTYKKQKKSLLTIFKNEKKVKEKLLSQFIVNLIKLDDNNLLWWKKELKKLKNSDDLKISNMNYRIKTNVYVGIFSALKFQSKKLNSEQQDYIHKLLKLIDPKFYQKTKVNLKNAL